MYFEASVYTSVVEMLRKMATREWNHVRHLRSRAGATVHRGVAELIVRAAQDTPNSSCWILLQVFDTLYLYCNSAIPTGAGQMNFVDTSASSGVVAWTD